MQTGETNPADRQERWPIDRLIPYARNARTHSEAQIAQIAASIREWGWTTPILVDEDGTVLAGHGRLAAARQLQMTEVPVIVASGWSDAKRRAYVLADNKLALNAGWDNEMLALELEELQSEFDLSLIGFDDNEIAHALASDENLVDTANTFATSESEWQGMPEFENNAAVYRKVVVSFASQEHVDDFAKLINQQISNNAKFIWHPYQERRDSESKRYATND